MKAQRRKILEYSLPRELNPGPKVGIYASQTFETSAINNFYFFFLLKSMPGDLAVLLKKMWKQIEKTKHSYVKNLLGILNQITYSVHVFFKYFHNFMIW